MTTSTSACARLAAEGAPDLKDVDLFLVPPDQGLIRRQPWKLELLVGRAIGATKKAFLTFDLDYSPPEKYLTFIAPEKPAARGCCRGLMPMRRMRPCG